MKRQLFLAVCILLMLAFAAHAGGKSAIVGVVKVDGVPLSGVNITIIGEATYTNASTTTNATGTYFFTNLPEDEYIIQAIAQPSGIYKPGTHNIFLGKHEEKEINFSLKKK